MPTVAIPRSPKAVRYAEFRARLDGEDELPDIDVAADGRHDAEEDVEELHGWLASARSRAIASSSRREVRHRVGVRHAERHLRAATPAADRGLQRFRRGGGTPLRAAGGPARRARPSGRRPAARAAPREVGGELAGGELAREHRRLQRVAPQLASTARKVARSAGSGTLMACISAPWPPPVMAHDERHEPPNAWHRASAPGPGAAPCARAGHRTSAATTPRPSPSRMLYVRHAAGVSMTSTPMPALVDRREQRGRRESETRAGAQQQHLGLKPQDRSQVVRLRASRSTAPASRR